MKSNGSILLHPVVKKSNCRKFEPVSQLLSEQLFKANPMVMGNSHLLKHYALFVKIYHAFSDGL